MTNYLEEIQYLPSSKARKESRCKIKTKKPSCQQSYFKWTLEQNLKYISVLQKIESQFVTEYERRSHKVFRKIAKKIKMRTSEQCRSHHQKMMKKYGTVQSIIQNIKKKCQKSSKLLMRIEQNQSNESYSQIQKGSLSIVDSFIKLEEYSQLDTLKKSQISPELKSWNWQSVLSF